MTQARVVNHQTTTTIWFIIHLMCVLCCIDACCLHCCCWWKCSADGVFSLPWVCLPEQVYKIEKEERGVWFFVRSTLWYCCSSLVCWTRPSSFHFAIDYLWHFLLFFFFFIHNWLSIWYDATVAAAAVRATQLLLLPAHQPVHSSIFPFIRPFAPYTATIP